MPRIAKKKIEEDEQKAVKGQKRYSRLRGMKDVLPDEFKYWNLALKKIKELAKVYSFARIETPVLEFYELYERSAGKASDIVSKEMFSFIDTGGEKVALRPEETPGIVRAYIEHGMFNLPQPVKLFSIAQLFRHEKPQSGRLRQHTQFDFEIIGESNAASDAQLALIAYNFFRELQIDVQIQINSIGCAKCRKEYIGKLSEYYHERGKKTKLCQDCKKRLLKNPLRLLDCKEPQCIALREEAPQIVDWLCEECRNHFIKVLEYLDDLEVAYNLNPYLVRGMDYYTKTVFEIWPAQNQGDRQISLGGGGRYDDLVEQMGGRPTPACGFGIGAERAIMKIREKNIPFIKENGVDIFIAQLGDQARRKAMAMFEEMRRSGFRVKEAFTKDSLKAQLEIANKMAVKYSLILGQKEIMDGTILIRDMESGIQEVVDYKKIKSELEKRLVS